MRANPIIAHFWQKDGSRESIARRLHNTFVNTIVTALQEPQWTSLLQRIGVDAMIHLLTRTSMFTSLPNGCLCQMTGPILLHVIPKSECERIAECSNKRKRPNIDNGPSDRSLKRIKISCTASAQPPIFKLREYVPPILI
ncbi:hypothetical protein FB446DRAFT_653838 [Lentinula raphanica]|nr:hypothetical protein FB446DRAFT_653838 [Lentinula raphanica]